MGWVIVWMSVWVGLGERLGWAGVVGGWVSACWVRLVGGCLASLCGKF